MISWGGSYVLVTGRLPFTWSFTWCGHTRRWISCGCPADVAKRASQIKYDPWRSPSSFIDITLPLKCIYSVTENTVFTLYLIGSNCRSLFHRRNTLEGPVYNGAWQVWLNDLELIADRALWKSDWNFGLDFPINILNISSKSALFLLFSNVQRPSCCNLSVTWHDKVTRSFAEDNNNNNVFIWYQVLSLNRCCTFSNMCLMWRIRRCAIL